MEGIGDIDGTEVFAEHRGLLFTVAYEMLGSTADAEDVVQESWLRWADRLAAPDDEEIRDPRAYLVRTVARQALNRLRTLQRRREEYVGPWLPEPLLTGPDVADDVELADSVSFAMLVVLETLSPLERAVFVLREVFDVPYEEIAAATDRSAAAVRQLASRARAHVAERRPRFEPRADQEEVAARFFAAAAEGDLQGLMDLLAPDVVFLTDGGGRISAARRPVRGADKVARFLLGVRPDPEEMEADWVTVNGAPGVVIRAGGQVHSVLAGRAAGGRIVELYAIRNPDKLTDLVERSARR